MRLSTLGWALVASTLLLLGAASRARAQEEDPRYLEIIRSAIQASGDSEWERARQLFEQAHAIQPSARTLRGIGIAATELGDHPAAVASLERALTDGRRPLTEEQRQGVLSMLQRATPNVVRADLEVDPADSTILVDGSDRAYTDPAGALLLAPGPRVVEAISGDRRARIEVLATRGQRLHIVLHAERPEQGGGGGGGMSYGPITEGLIWATVAGGGATLLSAIWLMERAIHFTEGCDRFGAGCLNREQILLERDAAIGLTTVLAIVTAGLGVATLFSALSEASAGVPAQEPRVEGPERVALRLRFGCGLNPDSVLCAAAGEF